jgi:hypothetical protein
MIHDSRKVLPPINHYFMIDHQLQAVLGTEILNDANVVQEHREGGFTYRFNVLCHFLTLSPIREESIPSRKDYY